MNKPGRARVASSSVSLLFGRRVGLGLFAAYLRTGAHGAWITEEPQAQSRHQASLCLILYSLLPLGLPIEILLLVGLGLHPIR